MPCSRRCGSLAQWCVLYANRYGAFSAYADAAMTAKHSIQTLMSRTSACRGRFDWRLAACPANTPAACYTWGCTPCSQSSFWGTVAIPGSPPRQHSDGTTDGAGSGSFPVAGACSSAVSAAELVPSLEPPIKIGRAPRPMELKRKNNINCDQY